jgi:hypothetical protein
MTHEWLQGAWAAMPTPWTSDGRIDAGIVAGEERHVLQLRNLIAEKYPQLAM